MTSFRIALLLTSVSLSPIQQAYAQLQDPLIQIGAVRTDYDAGVGMDMNFLTLNYQAGFGTPEGCLWSALEATTFGCPGRAGLPPLTGGREVWLGTIQQALACRGDTTRLGDSWRGCLTYQNNSFYSLNFPSDVFWVISANNDPSFDQCRPGPPNNSNPIGALNSQRLFKVGVDGIAPTPSKRIAMEINATEHNFFCTESSSYLESIPYLSVGVVKRKGNLGVAPAEISVGQNPGRAVRDDLSFSAKIDSIERLDCPLKSCKDQPCFCNTTGEVRRGSHGGLFIVAEWSGKPRAVYIDLFGEDQLDYSSETPIRALFNWPIENSIYFPGAEIIIFSQKSIVEDCGFSLPPLSTNQTNFSIDLSEAFACAIPEFETAPPEGAVEVTQIHWFIETYGTVGKVRVGFEQVNTGLQFRDSFEDVP